METNFENKAKVARGKIILMRPPMIKQRIQTLVEGNNLDLWNLD